MKICILNSSNPKTIHLESDEYVDLRNRKSCFQNGKVIKQCRSWHSWAYALQSEFFVYGKPKWPGIFQYDGVIILVNRDIDAVIPLVQKLKSIGKKVAVSFHEGVQDLITSSGIPREDVFKRWTDLRAIVREADFYINIFGQLDEFFMGWLGRGKVRFCNLSGPFDWDHEFTIPKDKRPYDVLIGTRSFNQRLSRNTFVTLGTLNGWAKSRNKNVHFLTEDGVDQNFLSSLGLDNIILHKGPLEWNDWLKFLAQFRAICHFDQSMNLGQICYDAAMVDVIPIGSTTWSNMKIGTDDNGDLTQMIGNLDRVFRDDEVYQKYFKHGLELFVQDVHPDAIRKKMHMEIFL